MTPMDVRDPNVAMLDLVAERLGEELLADAVFVGGAVAGLLVTDPAAPAIRPTEDVDLVFGAIALADHHEFEARLRARGFVHDTREGAPICRWRIGSVTVDAMPAREDVLGFSNRWYPLALETATRESLPSGRWIRLITAPAFIGTKLEAFDGRGNGDFVCSHDLGDALAVVDGRESLLSECRSSPIDLRSYLASRFHKLLRNPAFLDALPAHLPGDWASQERLPMLRQRLGQLAEISSV